MANDDHTESDHVRALPEPIAIRKLVRDLSVDRVYALPT